MRLRLTEKQLEFALSGLKQANKLRKGATFGYERYQVVGTDFYIDGLTPPQIAKKHGVSAVYIRKVLAKIDENFQRNLEKHDLEIMVSLVKRDRRDELNDEI
ncbi:hypothetical protein [Reinekea blandensis]|uniref:Uncharacterized protein n=1 Tax=Reinekea blandensis MED297 TaxID=314283 RepID=A4BJY1_9GAMM|nr:hypothetical protein [Reinekea blandensis]EAR07582.1 hypothetical protein MED297_00135 [Reinekea sp. MED297] [Reinekea blandensis MED297]